METVDSEIIYDTTRTKLRVFCSSQDVNSRSLYPPAVLCPRLLIAVASQSWYQRKREDGIHDLARVIEDEDQGSKRSTKYYLQRRATYCKGMGRGPEWTIEAYCEENGLGPYERANDLFLQIPFAFDTLPLGVRQDKEVQTMIYQAVFDFDRCLETSGRLGSYPPPDDDHEMIVLLTGITLNLIRRTAHLKLKE